jgi:hypothetical protein
MLGFRRKALPIYIWAPPYSPLSGGIRAMNLLCYHLNRLGYDAYINVETDNNHVSPVPLRYLDPLTREFHAQQQREPVQVYPEAIGGNPENAKFVVRYLLNKPGLLAGEWSPGKDDYFLTYAPEHVPDQKQAFDLFMPLVDRSIYFPPASDQPRDGFAIFLNRRPPPDPSCLPNWLRPQIFLSLKQPRSHLEVAQVYRRSRAMVIGERSSAIFEALSCGCPVVGIENENFNVATYQPRFRDCGIVWGFHDDRLIRATTQIGEFERRYSELERNLDRRITGAFDFIICDVLRRQRQHQAEVTNKPTSG